MKDIPATLEIVNSQVEVQINTTLKFSVNLVISKTLSFQHVMNIFSSSLKIKTAQKITRF